MSFRCVRMVSQAAGAIAAPIFDASVIPRSTTRPIVAARIRILRKTSCSEADDESSTQPAPVTVSVSTVNPATAAHLEAFTGEAMPEQTVTMTLDDALALTRDGGQKYGEIDNETLSHMANSLTKTLKSQTMSAEERATRERKLAGIKIILAHREAK